MNKILLTSLALLLSIGMWAQPGQRGERVKAERVAYITSQLHMTPQESAAFWPVYDEYSVEQKKVKKAYKVNADLNGVSDSEAEKIILDRVKMDEELLNLKKQYTNRLLNVLPASKLVKLPKAEREFKKMVLRKIQNRRGNK